MPVFIPPQSPIPNVFNFAPQNLKKWRAALAGVKAGASSTRLLLVGDSTTRGDYSNGSSSGNWQPLAMPTQLTALFNTAGINAHCNSWMGNGNGGDFVGGSHDSRGSATADWTSGPNSVGGGTLKSLSVTGNGYCAFTPATQVDTANIFYVQVTSSGNTMNANFDGGTNTNINTYNTANQVSSVQITTTLGTHTINVAQAAGTVYLVGVEAYNSAQKWVSVINAGWSSSKSGDWSSTSAPFGPLNGIAYLAPSLTLLNLTINDWNGSTALSTYISNMQAIINAALSTGDVVLVTGNPSNPSGHVSQAQQQQYVGAVYQLAQTNNLVLIDLFGRWVSYSASSTLYGDASVHPSGAGYADIARAVMNVIGSP